MASLLSLFLLALGREDELDRLLLEAGAVADGAEREWGAAAAAPVVTLVRLAQGRRSYQRGDLVPAREQLEAGVVLAELSARPTYVVLALVFRADLELATGDRAGAQETLVRAREIVDNDPVTPFVVTWLEEAETRIGRQAVKAAAAQGALFEELTDRELSILRMLPGTATAARDRRCAVPLDQHGQGLQQEPLPQARRRQPAGRRSGGATAGPHLTRLAPR